MSSSRHDEDPGAALERVITESGVPANVAGELRAILGQQRASLVPTTEPRAQRAPIPETRIGDDAISEARGRLGEAVTMAHATRVEGGERGVIPDRSSTSSAPSVRGAGSELKTLGLIAAGGMGEVHRAHDAALHRQLAMKILHESLQRSERMRGRFLEEAQLTAQLAHPGIPPVHQFGILPDGRPFFTMKEVHGRTLADMLEDREAAPSEHSRLAIFDKVCEAVAYAHARGVIHCDLKPHNIMVGAFGEVLVMDWGLARVVTPAGSAELTEAPIRTSSGFDVADFGVAGTPAYMPAEQAYGDPSLLSPATDVYSLGVMLYELLAGRRPYHGSAPEMITKASMGEIPPLPASSVADDAIEGIIRRAMAPKPAERYASAAELHHEISRWREGALQRERALSVVEKASAVLPGVASDRARAETLRNNAARLRRHYGEDADAESRQRVWDLEDTADELDVAAALREEEVVQQLQIALAHAPDLIEARRHLGAIYSGRHREAETTREHRLAARYEVMLRAQGIHDYASYLAGQGSLHLATEPAARASLYVFEERGRRLVPRALGELGTTPLDGVALPLGSYLIELSAPGRAHVLYPVLLERQSTWQGDTSPSGAPFALELPRVGEVGDDEIFVPGGPFLVGGNEAGERAHWAWLPSYIIQREPVTNREVARFLAAPEGAPYRRSALRDGSNIWRADWPSVGLSHEASVAYAAWYRARTGKPYRLPTELEWEKAARGVDGRAFPWGDRADPTFCHARAGERDPTGVTTASGNPVDQSVYGACGFGGNVRDWCATDPRSTQAPVRGGSFRLSLEAARAAARSTLTRSRGYLDVGVRLARSLETNKG